MRPVPEDGKGRKGRAPLVAAALFACVPAQSATRPDPLGQFVREGLSANLELTQRRLDMEKSRLDMLQARGHLLPSLSLEARYSEVRGNALDIGKAVNPAYEGLNQILQREAYPIDLDLRLPLAQETKLRLTQPIFHPASYYNYRIQANLHRSTRDQLAVSRRELAAEIKSAYLTFAKAAKVEEVYARTEELLKEQARVVERLKDNQRVIETAVLRSRGELSAMEQKRLEALRQRVNAAEYFNFLLNRPLDRAVERLPDSLISAFSIPLTLEKAVEKALEDREELSQMRHGLEAVKAQRKLARSAFLPNLGLSVEYGIQGNRYDFGPEQDFLIGSVVAQWSLFAGFQDAARVQSAALERRRQETRLTEVRRQIEMQVRRAYGEARDALAALTPAGDRLASVGKAFETVSRRFEQGMSAPIEVIDARTDFTNAEINMVLVRHELGLKIIALELSTAMLSEGGVSGHRIPENGRSRQ